MLMFKEKQPAIRDPPAGVSPDEAVSEMRDVLDSIGDTCPECRQHPLPGTR